MTFRSHQAARVLGGLGRFYEQSLDERLARAQGSDGSGEALSWLTNAAQDVPAYAAFLRAHGVTLPSAPTRADFERLPISTKENYHKAFPLPALCRGGSLDACDFVAVSSGSTGEPTIWPRFVTDELETAFRFEQVLRDAFRAHERRTLGIVCFALGSWVGGMFTTACCRHLAAKGYPLTLVTPGNNRGEILRVLQKLGPEFEQVVLFGYPPFLKDVVDAGVAEGIEWRRYRTRLVLAGEVFSEEWRELVCRRLGFSGGAEGHPALTTASLYGTADGGVLAAETPLSIQIRRFLAQAPDKARELFGDVRLPTLCQYDPTHRYFETDGESLLFSGDSGVPLLRYKILDRGGIVPYGTLLARLQGWGFDLERALGEITESAGTPPVRELPFVYVFGRSSFAVSFYGANVYPENVAPALERPHIAPSVTGKFVLEVEEDEVQNAELALTVELAASGPAEGDAFWEAEFAEVLGELVRTELERLNSEFAHYVPPERRTPRVRFRPLGDPEYFPVGVKHRYTRG
jgi:phenylacetate-CoA ligase